DNVLRRTSLIRLGLTIGLVQAAVAGGFLLLGNVLPVSYSPWVMLSALTASGIIVALLTSALLPMIEVLFDVTTGINLLELGNTHEAPLLRKLLIEAPGTFHHSYVVGLLAEAAAEAVGGNALLARVGALYHDIGKLNKPEYFAENSPEARGRHKGLAPEMSMLIISSHPRDGVELGRFYGLPREIIDFMPEHHGTSLIEYFYEHAKRLRGEDAVAEGDFRYPGPKPQRVETAIVMIADAVEAISRQMPDPSRARLEEMVHKVGMKRLMDGQFNECPMTLMDLNRIEAAMVRVLGAIYHTRATYPKGKAHPLDLSQPSQPESSSQSVLLAAPLAAETQQVGTRPPSPLEHASRIVGGNS
ncbi:MAG: putative nucleotidyltransferase with HDIG domain, partial [Planctomycetota bacterium]